MGQFNFMNAHGAVGHELLKFEHSLRILAPLRQDLGDQVYEHKTCFICKQF